MDQDDRLQMQYVAPRLSSHMKRQKICLNAFQLPDLMNTMVSICIDSEYRNYLPYLFNNSFLLEFCSANLAKIALTSLSLATGRAWPPKKRLRAE